MTDNITIIFNVSWLAFVLSLVVWAQYSTRRKRG
jgi:hypothetical protein